MQKSLQEQMNNLQDLFIKKMDKLKKGKRKVSDIDEPVQVKILKEPQI